MTTADFNDALAGHKAHLKTLGVRRAPGETINHALTRARYAPIICKQHLRTGHGPFGLACIVCGDLLPWREMEVGT